MAIELCPLCGKEKEINEYGICDHCLLLVQDEDIHPLNEPDLWEWAKNYDELNGAPESEEDT